MGEQRGDDMPLSPELVNCRRQEYEFAAGVEKALAYKAQAADTPLLLLFDGSLIFWHLASQENRFKRNFFAALS